MTRVEKIRLGVFFALPLMSIGGFLLWRWQSNRPPTAEMCITQADRRLEVMFGARLAEEVNEHHAEYDQLRNNMIVTCTTYWTRAYALCLQNAPTVSGDSCEHVGRVRNR